MQSLWTSRWSLAAAWVVLFAVSLEASARQELEAVEQTVADRGPLAMSLRNISIDLRQPTNFDRVYRVPGSTEHYLRANGALYAVFPRSVYARTRRGEVPRIPDGTVFYIGAPSFLTNPAPEAVSGGSQRVSHAVSYRVDDRQYKLPFTSTAPVGARLHPSPGQSRTVGRSGVVVEPTIITDPAYRAERLHLLMRQAAQGRRITGG